MVKGSDLSVNDAKCIGCGMCVSSFEELFHFNKEGKSEVIESGECEDCEISEVIEICPQDAIKVNKAEEIKKAA
ncbi:MAG: ferredoxin [Candidatus Berkelbacteria bacterium]